jgi:hypothetical protein
MSCNPAKRSLNQYYSFVVSKKAGSAEKYLSIPCKQTLLANQPNLSDAILEIMHADQIKTWEIGNSEQIGDTVFVESKVVWKDGFVLSYDKDHKYEMAGGRIWVVDERYRLYKEGKQWKIDLHHCRVKREEK